MRRKKEKIVLILYIFINIALISINIYAHSGRTDANGGHKDNKNKSGLGSYHYHCGGYPAHLHTGGICPYSSSNKSNSSSSNSTSSSSSTSTSSSNSSSNKNQNQTSTLNSNSTSNHTSTSTHTTSSSNNKTTSTSINKTNTNITTIASNSVKIIEKIENMKVGESKQLTTSVLPENTTNKNITWKSSNKDIITINETGKITAKGVGTANITASTSNGKTDTIKIDVINEIKQDKKENNVTTEIPTNQNSDNSITNNTSEDLNPIVGLLTIGTLGGGGYLIYKKCKKE